MENTFPTDLKSWNGQILRKWLMHFGFGEQQINSVRNYLFDKGIQIHEITREHFNEMCEATPQSRIQAWNDFVKRKNEELRSVTIPHDIRGMDLTDRNNLAVKIIPDEGERKNYFEADVCFLVDCTASMKPWIDRVKNLIVQISNSVNLELTHLTRFAFVGYRDVEDKDNIIVHPFTEDVKKLQHFISTINASGGDDIPEDYCTAYEQVLLLDWRRNNKILIHFADAPCHGEKYYKKHDEEYDNYPEGDPNGRNVETLVAQLSQLAVQYTFSQINSTTNEMIEIFNSIFSYRIKRVEFSDNPGVLKQQLISTVLLQINAPIETQAQIMLFDCTVPRYEDLRQVFITRYRDNNQIKTTMRIASKPFAEGMTRYAYHAYVEEDGKPKHVIVKRWKNVPRNLTQQRCIEQTKCHLMANTTISQIFDYEGEQSSLEISYGPPKSKQELQQLEKIKELKTKVKNVRFITMEYFRIDTEGQDFETYFTLEEIIPGDFEKFTNNYDYAVDPRPGSFAEIAQLFSHFSFIVLQNVEPKGYKMIVDIQGVKTRWTDPAVHSSHCHVFGNTDLKIDGIKAFIRKHNIFNERYKLMCCDVLGKLHEKDLIKF